MYYLYITSNIDGYSFIRKCYSEERAYYLKYYWEHKGYSVTLTKVFI